MYSLLGQLAIREINSNMLEQRDLAWFPDNLKSGSTMAGPVRVTDPIENALGDSALVRGRV